MINNKILINVFSFCLALIGAILIDITYLRIMPFTLIVIAAIILIANNPEEK